MAISTTTRMHINPLYWTRRLYDWLMKWAEHGHAVRALCALSAIEAIFFPIPVDPLLLAMGTAKPKKAFGYAVLATLFSVGGGLIGYAIGYAFWDATQEFFYQYIISAEKFQIVTSKFQENAFWALFLAGLTPIPFKVFTLAAGVANVALIPFLAGSLVGRSLRFMTIGVLLFFFGPAIRQFIERYFEKITLVTGIFVVIFLVVYFR